MLKNKLIVLLLYQPWQWSTDYQNQTVKTLQKYKNKVVIYYGHKETALWKKEGIKTLFTKNKEDLNFFIPIHFFPLRRLSFIKNINQLINIYRLNKLCKKLFKKDKKPKISKAIFWFFEPNSLLQSLHLLNIKHHQLIFDCVDYFPRKELSFAIKSSSHIFCISKNLQQLLKKLNKYKKNIDLVPQGFDLANFKKNHKLLNTNFANKSSKKIIGFVGGIDNRLDYSLIINLIKNNPHWQFVFYGPEQKLNAKNKQLLKKIKSFTNTNWGKVSKKEIANTIINFDIGIIPYDVKQKKNYYCYPMKLFEYFYLGKPVVSTAIIELQRKKFRKFVRIAKDNYEFEKSIKTLLSQDWSINFQQQQRQLAFANSWQNKIKAIKKKLIINSKKEDEKKNKN